LYFRLRPRLLDEIELFLKTYDDLNDKKIKLIARSGNQCPSIEVPPKGMLYETTFVMLGTEISHRRLVIANVINNKHSLARGPVA
jgi:hypothetical protein